ncbi:MAG: CpaF family protein [Bdellovibrionota bacterium]
MEGLTMHKDTNIQKQVQSFVYHHLSELIQHRNMISDEVENKQKIFDDLKKEVEINLKKSGHAHRIKDNDQFIKDTIEEIIGLGPLKKLLQHENISEIMINGAQEIYVEIGGKIKKTKYHFLDERSLQNVIKRLISHTHRRVDESSPMLDTRLQDGSRINIILPPLSLNGPTITIRKFKPTGFSFLELVASDYMNQRMANYLRFMVEHRKNILVAGGTGSGKTSLLNTLSDRIDPSERIVTIEDAAELNLSQPHVIRLESRPSNTENVGEVTIRDLLKNALRMRPNRIIIGECRSNETLDMLSAMNTGHDGSMSTIHANSPRDALARLETLVLMSGMELPHRAIREQIASAIDVIVFVKRGRDGQRMITQIVEMKGMEEGTIITQDIFFRDQEDAIQDQMFLSSEYPSLQKMGTSS